jgi:hydrogenase/urease accessory protein HupE
MPACAHELRPAYVELTEVAPATWDLLWKVPARGDDRRLALALRLPDDCRHVRPPTVTLAGGAWVERSRIACVLSGGTIAVDGLAATLTDVLVRVARADGAMQIARMTPDRPWVAVEAEPRPLAIARTYLLLGIEHILTGADHLLFVLGLILLVRGAWRLVKTISAFTASHSVTLALATLGVVHVPPAPVEAVIALSIVFVAREVVLRREGPPTLAERQPWLVAFCFGLLHGLGFAGGLSEAGLPAGHVPLALLLFSCGVEVGHVAFVAVALAVLALGRRVAPEPPAWLRAAPGYAIGCAAAFWMLQRVAAF